MTEHMTEPGQALPEQWLAVYTTLADAQAMMEALQAAGVPYPAIRLGTHTASELAALDLDQRAEIGGRPAPKQFWSLAVRLDPQWRDKAQAVLREHPALALGHLPSDDNRTDDTERGAIAWRHYVFETSAATDTVGEGAGTTGMTGIISSGVFAEGAKAEGNPPADALAPSDQRASNADQQPNADTKTPKVAVDENRSRPQTKLE